MNIWKSKRWKDYYSEKKHRGGIKIDYDRDVNEDVKSAVKQILAWLRVNYDFPVRVRIYVKNATKIKARDGEMVLDTFFWPYSRDDEPYIRMATGDYSELLLARGRDDALTAILISLLRNLTHYFYWLNDVKLTPIAQERQATRYARIIFYEYADTIDHP